MDFNHVVEYYERIAKTQKRLKIIDILAELFEECKYQKNLDDLPKIIYLSQGRLVSEIEEWPKFGIAEKMFIQSMVKYMGMSAIKIKSLINKKGDVGEAVKILLQKRVKKKIKYSMDAFTKPTGQKSTKKLSAFNKTKKLEIQHLYKELTKLSHTSGKGSQEAKINIIIGIFRKCNPESAKYVVNIILSTLRIGIATKTIMDALAQAITGTKDTRSIIERKYNIFPDLGSIATILMNEGLNGLNNISIKVHTPIKMMLASRIQYTQIQQKLGDQEFLAEYKYDGERVQVHKKGNDVVLYSRRLSKITQQYPDVIDTVLKQVNAKDAIFEGEIVAMDPFFEKMLPFQVLSTRRRKYDIEQQSEEVPVCLYCFDILYVKKWNGKLNTPDGLLDGSFLDIPIQQRRKHLELLIDTNDRIQLSDIKKLNSTSKMVKYFKEAREAGAEGIINKKIGDDAIYKAGNRGFLWIKLKGLEGAKMQDTIDVVIIGADWGKGRRKGVLSPLYGAIYNNDMDRYEFLTKIGSGFTDEVLIQLTEELKDDELPHSPSNVLCSIKPDVWLNPRIVIEIMGDELTISNKADAGTNSENSSGFGLRFLVFQRTRKDKSLTQITSSNEIVRLYEMQN